jgi:hypothetical protein
MRIAMVLMIIYSSGERNPKRMKDIVLQAADEIGMT